MVKKILKDGSECKKCKEVSERLEVNDEMRFIDRVAYADVRDPGSEGFQLAIHHGMDIAPFFIVNDKEKETVYKTYLELRKKAFNREPTPEDIRIEEKRKPPACHDEDMDY
ncbi:MAG: hypothetical protein ABII90_15295 [Bacteroidota bacterium]